MTESNGSWTEVWFGLTNPLSSCLHYQALHLVFIKSHTCLPSPINIRRSVYNQGECCSYRGRQRCGRVRENGAFYILCRQAAPQDLMGQTYAMKVDSEKLWLPKYREQKNAEALKSEWKEITSVIHHSTLGSISVVVVCKAAPSCLFSKPNEQFSDFFHTKNSYYYQIWPPSTLVTNLDFDSDSAVIFVHTGNYLFVSWGTKIQQT